MELERQDRQRFEEESARADEERLKLQEERRNALVVQEGEVSGSRGARQRIQEERAQKLAERERRRLAREAEMDEEELAERQRIKDEKRRETEERQRKRAEEEAALNKQQRKLDKEQAKKASQRLEYLFKQSSIFAKLKMGTGGMDEENKGDGEGNAEDKKDDKASSKTKTRSKSGITTPSKKAGVHHIHAKDSEEEEEEDEEQDNHVFLTKQPNCIKFGKLKPYQLESLNWMIHLAEKGLNGILADEVSKSYSDSRHFCIHRRAWISV